MLSFSHQTRSVVYDGNHVGCIPLGSLTCFGAINMISKPQQPLQRLVRQKKSRGAKCGKSCGVCPVGAGLGCCWITVFMLALHTAMLRLEDERLLLSRQNYPHQHQQKETDVPAKKSILAEKDPNLKYILYFTEYWGRKDFDWGEGHDLFVKHCPVSDCYITSKTNLLPKFSDFDAFLYHGHHDTPLQTPQKVRAWRQPHHRFILMGQESPAHRAVTPERRQHATGHNVQRPSSFWWWWHSRGQLLADPYDSFFHWTMNYRWDSDFPFPYGWFLERAADNDDEKRSSSPQRRRIDPYIPQKWKTYSDTTALLSRQQQRHKHLAERPRQVAWMVSNCHSRSHREQYVQELSKYISVDIFGGCGGIPCNQTYDDATRVTSGSCMDNCTATIRSDYKFYLSFENAFCDDYVTEKFFSNVNDHVVIVLGGANYSVVAPPHSYIDVLDYSSPRALAQYLHELDRNDTAYLSYFWWKEHYRVTNLQRGKNHPDNNNNNDSSSLDVGRQAFMSGLCRVCQGLREESNNDPPNVYDDLQTWYKGTPENPRCGKRLPQVVEQISGDAFGAEAIHTS